jgi:hypothetical protein
MTNTLKIAAVAAMVALSMPAAAFTQSRAMYIGPDVVNSSLTIGPQGDPNGPYGGYFTDPEMSPHYHGSNGG